MQMLMSIAIVVQIIAAIAVIILVLLQHGKGADLGATAVAATIFFCATIAITLGSGVFQKSAEKKAGGVLGTVTTEQTAEGGATSQPNNDLQSNQIPR